MATEPGQFASGKRIIVVGGGIAGLTFVSALDRLWNTSLQRPDITIIERENREASINQDPYMLSLNGGNQDEGLVALQQLGLLDKIRAHATLNSGIIRVWSDAWKQLASIDPKPYGDLPAATMRITRQNLKRILVEKAESTDISWQWACTCTAAERLSTTGQIRVSISNVETGDTFTQDCDLLIAADGASSKIRESFRPHDMQLKYAGATQIGGIAHFPKGLPRPIHEDYGLQISSGEGVCCIYTPFDYETIGWTLSRKEPERKAKSGPFSSEELAALQREALQTGSMFSEPFQSVIEATVGADLALKDGWDLAEQICQNISLETAVAAYDKLSILRTEHVLNFSHERIRFGHSTGFLWKVYKYGMAVQGAVAKKDSEK